MRLPMYPKDSVYRVFCDKPRYTRGIPRPTAFQTRVISLIYHGFILKPSGKLERTLVQRIRSDFLSISDLYQIGPEKSWTRNLGPGRIGKESLRTRAKWAKLSGPKRGNFGPFDSRSGTGEASSSWIPDIEFRQESSNIFPV